MKLSEHFALEEFISSKDTGARSRMLPCHVDALRALCSNTLERIRTRSAGPDCWRDKPVTVTSGFRTSYYNVKIGGSKNSQHMYGQAADIVAAGQQARAAHGNAPCGDAPPEEVLSFRLSILHSLLVDGNRMFDQLIFYPTFIHVSFRIYSPNRGEILSTYASGGSKGPYVSLDLK